MPRQELVFLTRRGCHLCERALGRVQKVCRWLRRDLVVRDITEDRMLEDEYHLRVPVLLDGNGRVVAEGMMTMGRLLRGVWRS